MGAELFDADGQTDDGQTDTAKLLISFRNFWKAPKNQTVFMGGYEFVI